MKQNYMHGLAWRISFFLIITFSIAKPETYYEFIGINANKLKELKSNAKKAVESNAEYQALITKIGGVPTAKQQKDLDKLVAKIEQASIVPEIKQACFVTRKNLRKELDESQEAVELAEDFDRTEKYNKFSTVQKRYRFSTTVCDVLLDSKKRIEYDKKLTGSSSEQLLSSVEANINSAMRELPNKKILLNQIVGDLLSQIEIPSAATKIFNKDLELRDVKFLPMPLGPDVRYGLGFSGLMALNGFEVRLSAYLIKDNYDDFKFSFTVELPAAYKVTSLFPSLTYLDSFKFPQAKFIIASFEGSDSEGFPFKRGFNFGAQIDLEGPFKILNELKDKSTHLKSLVFESTPIILSGVIPAASKDILKATFSANVPMRIGVDLRKIQIIPKPFSDVINRITTDDFTLEILPVKAHKTREEGESKREFTFKKVEKEIDLPDESSSPKKEATYAVTDALTISLGYRLQMETGIRINLGTQSDPIRLGVLGDIIPVSKGHPEGLLSVSGLMKNMLELKWLAIGNAALSFDFDGALMPAAAAAGIPFTGIGIRGQIDLGTKGDARAVMKAAGGFRVSGGAESGVPLLGNVDLIFDLSAENIRFANLASYATELAAKAKLIKRAVPVENIPAMTLHKVAGYCAFSDTTIAGKKYNAGIALQVETQFFDRKAGFRIAMDDKFRLAGWGYMPHLNWKVKDTEVFRLTGLTSDRGPRIAFSFDPAEPLKGSFGLEAIIGIPALTLKQKVDFNWSGSTLNADFESKFADFTVIFGVRMNTKEGTEMVSKYDELLKGVNNLYEKADHQNRDVIAAKKMIDGIQSFMKTKDYSRVEAVLNRAKNIFEQNQKDDPASFKLSPSNTTEAIDELFARVAALKMETEFLLESMKKYGLPSDSVEKKVLQAGKIFQELENAPVVKKELAMQTVQKIANVLEVYKKYMQKALGKNLKEIEEAYEKRLALEKSKPSPLRTPLEGLKQKIKAGKIDDKPFLLQKKQVVVDSSRKWQKLAVKFGFKGDFSAFINKYAVQGLQKMQDNALKKLDQINAKIASLASKSMQVTEDELVKTKQSITDLQSKIDAMRKECSSLSVIKQASCRSKIAVSQARLKAQQGYLNILLQPGKKVVKGIAGGATATSKAITQSKAVREATEGVLSVAVAGMDLIAKGLAMINVTEVRGEYNWDDMRLLRLPKLVKLVARIELPADVLPPMDIVLQDLQFDFRKPQSSASSIAQSILMSVVEAQQNKYLGYAIALAE